MGKILCILKQWLITERAKAQWKKYKAMVDDAKSKTGTSNVGLSRSPKETAPILGNLPSSDFAQINPFHFRTDNVYSGNISSSKCV